jgi:hypothetical protein
VRALPAGTERERARRRWCERLLCDLERFRELYYATSPNTPRVFAAGSSVNQLPRDVRRVAFAGCVECDLKAAQLAVVARLWGVGGLQAFLEASLRGGPSVWEELAGRAGVPLSRKPILKTTVYSVVFGMSRRNLLAQLARGEGAEGGAEGVGAAAAARFFRHPLVRELLRARDRAKRATAEAGGALDAWGNFVEVDAALRDGRYARRDVLSVMSAVVQSYELRLMLPALEVVKKEQQLYLLSWLHDGVTVHAGNRGKLGRQVRRLARAVAREAAALGMATELEVTELPAPGLPAPAKTACP